MPDYVDLLASLDARRHLDEINRFLLNGEGEIVETPGKLNLVWIDPVYDEKRFLAIKAAGDEQILINGRRCPATEAGLKQGLRACLSEMKVLK